MHNDKNRTKLLTKWQYLTEKPTNFDENLVNLAYQKFNNLKRLLSLTVLSIFIATISTVTAQEKDITLEEIWGGEFRTERLDALRSLKNGKEYSVLNYNRKDRVSTIDVYDYNDDLQIIADCEDIVEIMEGNNITAGEMIDYLREGEYALDIDEIYQWLEMANVQTICAVSKKCIDLLRHEYTEAELGRVAYVKKANQLEAEQKVMTGGPHVREV